MKHNIMRTILSATLLLSLAAVASAQDHGTCTTATVAGDLGYTFTGTLSLPTGPVPFAGVGRGTWDAAGNVSNTQTSSVGGTTIKNVVKGTYTVNPDCTGTVTVNIYDLSGNLVRTATWDSVIEDNGTEYRAIMTSLRLADGTPVPAVVTMIGKRISGNPALDALSAKIDLMLQRFGIMVPKR
mgnify:CR=1 FL=1